jgi:2OG-Fe(II) oxygenase superfamily
MKVQRIDLSSEAIASQVDSSKSTAWVIDDSLPDEFLRKVNEFRLALPLDAKRPTVKRRFFSSAKQCPAIREGLQEAVRSAIGLPTQRSVCANQETELTSHGTCCHKLEVHILAYMRFLEYDQVGGCLDPHTDGNKVCEDTGLSSTHTMLLYLRDCEVGGETILLAPSFMPKDTSTRGIVKAVKPQVGRILLFPHPTWHEGAPTVDVPKLCLRAEVAIHTSSHQATR